MEPGKKAADRRVYSLLRRAAPVAVLVSLAGCGADLSPVVELGEPVSIPIEQADPQVWRIQAPPASFVEVTVTGQGVDVRAAVVADGADPRPCDAPNRRMGMETLLVDPGHSGPITIRIERNDHSGARGKAMLEAVALPTVTADDQLRVEAVRQDARACLAFPDQTRSGEAAAAFEAAADAWHRVGDRRRAGLARLHAAGVRYQRAADWRASARLAAVAFTDLERAGAPVPAAFALRLEGAALDQLANAADFDVKRRDETAARARRRLTAAAGRFRELHMPYEQGFALSYRGVSQVTSGDWPRGRADFLAALRLFEAAGDGPAQAIALQSLAYQSFEDGRSEDSASEFERALALIPRDEDPANYAHTLHNSALPLRVLGRFDEAIARHHEAAGILRRLGDREGEARALHSLGTALITVGEPERAAELLRTAIRLRGDGGARNEQAVALVNLAEIERAAGRAREAIALDREALALATIPVDRARALLSLARDQMATGDLAAARHSLDAISGLGLPASNRFVAQATTELADLEAADGDRSRAEGLFARALATQRDTGAELDRARTLQRRAAARLRAGDAVAALADATEALSSLDGIGVQGLQAEARAAFRASYRDAVELMLEILLRNADSAGDDDNAQAALRQAFATSDRARAQLLSESAGTSDAALPAGLAAERRRCYELLAGKRLQLDHLLDQGHGDATRALDLARDIESLRTQARILESRIARSQQGVLLPPLADDVAAGNRIPPGTVVAEYFLGRRHSWLFEVRSGRVTVHTLAPAADLERMARELHVTWRRPARVAETSRNEGRRLARSVLAPLGNEPAGSLWIVPDGALHLVPMAVLARQHWPGLATGAAIVIPALSTLRPASATTRAEGTLAVVADPVYESDDPRIRAAARPAFAAEAPRPGRGDRPPLRRLPSTAIEARELATLVADPDSRLVLLGTDASRARLAAARLDRYHIVHFALHALADSRDPALAMLALSQFDADGRPEDGALRLYDIAQLRLNADLVVLSGCDTALGREIAGEGPIGLSHAFLRAGARSVVATLWQVPDSSTAALMREFYRELLVNGRAAPAALELAQSAIRRQSRWSDPYFWAGFQFVSNARLEDGNNNDVAGREES
jgi:CHAT domain-containing protein/tetratricopeptide (TPR) repeat protein